MVDLPLATCAWPLDTACFTQDWLSLPETTKTRAVQLASATLRRLTAYRVGGCPITVRPCKRSCASYLPSYWSMSYSSGSGPFWPNLDTRGLWVNSCGCQTDCACTALCEIRLPAPVGEVTEVKVDGDIVDPDDYRVDGSSLVWVGTDDCPWPTCQDLALADTEPGTFSVTYLNAYPVDQTGAYAAAILAVEFAKACTGQKCRLPMGVTSISRQGVSMTIASGAFPGGLTGIREVDTYIALWNPRHLDQGPRIFSPDVPRTRIVG